MTTAETTTLPSSDVEAVKGLDESLQNLIRSFILTDNNKSDHHHHGGGDDDDFEHVSHHHNDTDSTTSNDSSNIANQSAAIVEAVAELAAATTATPMNQPSTSTSVSVASDTTKEADKTSDVAVTESAEVSSEEEKDGAEDTSGDETALSSITKVNESIEKKLYELERVTQRLAQHIVRLIALSWRARAVASTNTTNVVSSPSVVEAVSTNSRQAKSMSNRMEYEAGVASEWLFNQLMLLDNIRGSSIVRAARKSSVAKIKSAISTADAIRARAKRAALAFHSIIDRQVARLPAAATSTTPTPTPNAPAPTTARSASPTTKSAEVPKTDTKRSSSNVEEKKEVKATPPAAAAKPKTGVQRDESLRWSPKFVSRELLDGVMIASMLGEGIKPSSLTINVDEDKHLLHISGVRPIKQRIIDHEATARAQAIADAKFQAQQQQQQQQQYYEDEYDNEDEEEEENGYGYGYGGWFGMPVRQQRRRHHPHHPQRLHHTHRRPPVVEPITKIIEKEAWFDEKLQLPVWLSTDTSLYRTSFDESSGRLSISIPKLQQKQQTIPVTPKSSFSSPLHHHRRQPAPSPFYHTQEYDDDNDDVYEQSHPYHAPPSYYAPQYQRRPAPSSYGYGYRPSPFGFGW